MERSEATRFVEPEFAFTQSTGFGSWRNSTFIIATIQNISADKYADLPVPIPPIPEQSGIIQFLHGRHR
jgi:type I restriction enzyme, S subunit